MSEVLSDAAPASPQEAGAAMPTLRGYFARFNEWTLIDSVAEGTFMERIAPGAFAETIARDRARIRVLFQHGKDPQAGSKPLGPIRTLREDEQGGYFEVPLLDTAYNRELVPGLRAGVYGASFRFAVQRERFDPRPPASSYNERGLPERTLEQVRLLELGPVSFPAYQGATVGVRSMTDWLLSS